MLKSAWSVGFAAVLSLAVLQFPTAANSEDPLPPAVGTVVLEDDLTTPNLVRPYSCKTGRAGLDYVGEGMRLKLTGACNDGEIFAAAGAYLRGLAMADGEVRVDVKAVRGVGLARFNINVRGQPFTPGSLNSAATVPPSYAVAIEPGHGRGLIGKVGTHIVERDDLVETLSADDWNTIAIRLDGPNFWMLVNDQPISHFTDASLDRGDVTVGVLKMGSGGDVGDGARRSQHDPSDTTEVVMILRNLRVSALADGDPSRVPTYQKP